MTTVVVVTSSGSVPPSAGTGTLLVPPGLSFEVSVTAVAVGVRSMPKLTLVTLLTATDTARMPSGVPSLPAPAPIFSPVLTNPEGVTAGGARLPIRPWFVLNITE